MALGHLNAGIRCPEVTNNTSDKATSRKSSGGTVGACSYASGRADYKMC
ncbi:hypothetical protein ACH4TX_45335 [Streptomyces sp. NPDC021098]